MDSKPEDKRAARRVSYHTEVECEGASTGRLNTRISDLSATGAFIDSVITFPVGSILGLKFRVKSIEFQVTGEVVHCMPHVGMGVRFLDLNPEQRAAIERVVAG